MTAGPDYRSATGSALHLPGTRRPARVDCGQAVAVGGGYCRRQRPGHSLRKGLVMTSKRSSGSDLERFPDLMDCASSPVAAASAPVTTISTESAAVAYDAWDEPDRTRRNLLARKALVRSPLCADAWLQLSELNNLSDIQRREYLSRAVSPVSSQLANDDLPRPRAISGGPRYPPLYARALRAGVGPLVFL